MDGETVGLIGLQLQFPLNFNAWIGEVQELVVLPQMRGLQVGQALLAWAEQEARSRGATMVELSSGKARPRRPPLLSARRVRTKSSSF
ncbi:aminoalkylphosphonic acid N-acetyltransferase [Raoultella terrigena]|uniref:Aminoalkylphosphonic acid N-acetyltransferase n=1 Tax=Raoultella terrigena TaxID=577 RepID=A0A3P8M531_RAOTE|nr:aminoalkylphosphonic acid N-acetyltransferase [Raoultella terrigena]